MYEFFGRDYCILFTISLLCSGVPRGGVGLGDSTPPPEITKALQNRAKLNPIVKTVKKLLNLELQHPTMFGKKAVKF